MRVAVLRGFYNKTGLQKESLREKKKKLRSRKSYSLEQGLPIFKAATRDY